MVLPAGLEARTVRENSNATDSERAPSDCGRSLTCASDRERPRCQEFASRGAVTPTTDTNRFGRHDPLSDVRVPSAQVSDYIGQLCGIF
jgi:hypothetical protein